MATRNPEKEEKRKTQIIQAAYDVIASKGYNNFTIDDIAHQAGLSKGGVLHYFKTKDDILIHLLEQIYTLIENYIKKKSDKYKAPEKKLKAVIIAYIIVAKKNPAFYIVMVDFWAQITINERVKSINTRIFDKMCQEIRKIIDLGIKQGVFNEIDSLNASYAIVAMVTNISIQWAVNNSIYNIDHVSRKCMNIVMSYLKK
jgi:AcrR family transcriptional regulator